MRVIAGTAGSLRLKTPEGQDTRPTTDRIKETLFNMLTPYLEGGVFVDLFAGSGGIGLEALSRGASKCYFVEKDARAMQCIKENAAFTKLADRSVFLRADVFGTLPQIPEKKADVIFMDPPYGHLYEKKVLELLSVISYVTEDTLIIAEAALDTDFSYLEALGFLIVKEKRYKTNMHLFVRKKG